MERNTAIVESEQTGEDLEAMESFEGVPKTTDKRELVGVMHSDFQRTLRKREKEKKKKRNNNPCKRLLSKIGNHGASVKILLHLKN